MKRKTLIAVISLYLIWCLCFAFVTPAFAKYIIKLGEQSEFESENFYFFFDYLNTDDDTEYEIYGNSVTFNVRNYIDSLRINKTDINYTVTADDGTLDKTSGTLTGNASNSDRITLTYSFGESENKKEISVTATSTDMYKKELTAKFILLKPENLAYEIKDEKDRDYSELYIYTPNTPQNITLNWDNSKIVIDETNDYVFNSSLNSDKNSVEINNIAVDTTVKIVFFKKDISQNYTCALTEFDGTITIS